MSVNKKLLLNEIEEYRSNMMKTADETSLSSLKVIELSTKLDALLNEYNKYENKGL